MGSSATFTSDFISGLGSGLPQVPPKVRIREHAEMIGDVRLVLSSAFFAIIAIASRPPDTPDTPDLSRAARLVSLKFVDLSELKRTFFRPTRRDARPLGALPPDAPPTSPDTS